MIPVFKTPKNLEILDKTQRQLYGLGVNGNTHHSFPDGYEFYYADSPHGIRQHEKIKTNGAVFNEKVLYSQTPLYLSEIFMETLDTIRLAKKVLKILDYDELIIIRLVLKDSMLKILKLDQRPRDLVMQHAIQIKMEPIQETISLSEFDEKELLRKLCLGILSYFNWSIDENVLEEFINNNLVSSR